MLAYTYVENGKFELREKPNPTLQHGRDAIARVTLGSICTSDCTSSMVLYQGLFPVSRWAIKTRN